MKNFKILLFAAILIFCISACGQGGKTKVNIKQGNVKGIKFEEFFNKVKDEGQKWAGEKFYLSTIQGLTEGTYIRSGGYAPMWNAKMLLCDQFKEETNKITNIKETICLGKSRDILFSSANILAAKPGITIDGEESYAGVFISADSIKISLAEAEKIAIESEKYQLIGGEDFSYGLKAEQFSNLPYWTIIKQCNLKSANQKCEGVWTVKINALTGEIIND
ncbi:MAG: hypothetical protein NTZ49_00820 [Candidatus Parcubacteria bacterium]|nr:hypothetical protein [Candidatus Parcubacteria bacterium]